jgi:hypothetical protein
MTVGPEQPCPSKGIAQHEKRFSRLQSPLCKACPASRMSQRLVRDSLFLWERIVSCLVKDKKYVLFLCEIVQFFLLSWLITRDTAAYIIDWTTA